MYLLDTNVISETRKLRPHGGVMAWLGAIDNSALHLSAVSAGEIQWGIELARRHAPAKAAELEMWLEEILDTFRVLPMDAPVFRRWAKLKLGRPMTLYDDAMIAATAMVHDLTVVTRNVRDFAEFDIELLNPFKPSPA
jgi:predicted nucleic acid-binding protein